MSRTDPPGFEQWNPGAHSETRAEVIVPASPMTIEGIIEAHRNMAQYARHGTSGWRRVTVRGAAVVTLLFLALWIVATLVTVVAR